PMGDPAHGGLGWMPFDWGGERVYGHDGGTIGQSSFMRILPSRKAAVALLTNGGMTGLLYREMFGMIFERLAGIAPPPIPEAPEGLQCDAARYEGSYERISSRIDVAASDGGLDLTVTPRKVLVPGTPPQVIHFKPVDERQFVSAREGWTPPQLVTFGHFDAEGRAGSVFSGFRLNPRVR
ncbi:serine hydrolase, partial [bacterium]|nr:serine hydrolase [bacterium]